jgi:3' exoribonuclease, RNase T-like
MRFWFDTEFFEDGRVIDLISIGLVSEDGREYYAETPSGVFLAGSADWLKLNVLPHLKGPTVARTRIARDITEFVGEKPEFWAYYADYDWVALCQLYGRMIDLPKGWPMFCRDVKQLADLLGNPALPKQESAEHHALADARWTKDAWAFCKAFGLTENIVR